MEILAAWCVRLEIAGAFIRQGSLVRRPKIGRPAKQPRYVLRKNVQRLARCFASRNSLGVSGEHREVAIPTLGQLPFLHVIDFACELWKPGAIGVKEAGPLPAGVGATI